VAEAAARLQDCLLTHCEKLAEGMKLGLDVGNKTVTALPLLLPDFMPCQKGLPTFLARLAGILRQPAGAQDVEGMAEVCHGDPAHALSAIGICCSRHLPHSWLTSV